MRIAVILGSSRRGRQSPKVAKFVMKKLAALEAVEGDLLDLHDFDLPMMEERLHKRDDPPPRLQELSDRVKESDSVIIVSPEYNSGYPAVLKNAVDYLDDAEFARKPVGIITVSAGPWGGLRCLHQLQQVVLSTRGVPIPASLPVTNVRESFDDDGTPADDGWQRRADRFLEELIWWTEATMEQRARSPRR